MSRLAFFIVYPYVKTTGNLAKVKRILNYVTIPQHTGGRGTMCWELCRQRWSNPIKDFIRTMDAVENSNV